jgi:hypothetical protein
MQFFTPNDFQLGKVYALQLDIEQKDVAGDLKAWI